MNDDSPGSESAKNVVIVTFGTLGRPLICDAGNLRLPRGQQVVVDDRRDGAVATVTVASHHRLMAGPLPRIRRVANDRDLEQLARAEQKTADALSFARQRARAQGLDIKVFLVNLSHRMDRATVFFAAEQRVDFRALVRDLSTFLRMRVELRQVGVRDEAKMVGGIGSCGRELCCSTFLPRFEPISIRMAKNQNLALAPNKVSGQCGRLKCCLVYEDATYVEASRNLPRVGKAVDTPQGQGRVAEVDVLRGRVRVAFADKPTVVFPAAEVRRREAAPPVKTPER